MKPGKGERAVQVLVALVKSMCYLTLFLGSQVLVMLPVAISAAVQTVLEGGLMDEGRLYDLLIENAMAYSLAANLFTLVVLLAFYLVQRRKLSEALWLRPVPAPTLLTGASLAPGLYLMVIVVLSLLPDVWQQSYREVSAGLDGGGVIVVLAVAVAAPVVEEFIFRGLIMTRLSKAMPGWLAVVLSAAVFGACHGHPVWFGYAFVLGMVFGLIDLRAGSIWPSIMGHLTFNAIGQIISFVPETEEGMELVAAMGVLLIVAIAAPILNRRAIAGLFRPARKSLLEQVMELPVQPGNYDFDPWEE